MKTVIGCHLSLFLHLKLQFQLPFVQCVSAQYVQFLISSVLSVMRFGTAQFMKINKIQYMVLLFHTGLNLFHWVSILIWF